MFAISQRLSLGDCPTSPSVYVFCIFAGSGFLLLFPFPYVFFVFLSFGFISLIPSASGSLGFFPPQGKSSPYLFFLFPFILSFLLFFFIPVSLIGFAFALRLVFRLFLSFWLIPLPPSAPSGFIPSEATKMKIVIFPMLNLKKVKKKSYHFVFLQV